MKTLLPYLILLIVSSAIAGCNQFTEEHINSELLNENINNLNRQITYDQRYLNLINDRFKKLLDISYPDSIDDKILKEAFKNIDSLYFKESTTLILTLKENYNESLISKDSLYSKNYLVLFKSELINYCYESIEFCGPDPRYNELRTFTKVLTLKPTQNKVVDLLISKGRFDTSFVDKIYIGGVDSAGFNSSLITDTLFTEKGFGKYSFTPTKKGINVIQGVFEFKTKRGLKYKSFETEIYVD